MLRHDVVPRQVGARAFEDALPTATNVRVFGDTAVLMTYLKMATSARSFRSFTSNKKRAQGSKISRRSLAIHKPTQVARLTSNSSSTRSSL